MARAAAPAAGAVLLATRDPVYLVQLMTEIYLEAETLPEPIIMKAKSGGGCEVTGITRAHKDAGCEAAVAPTYDEARSSSRSDSSVRWTSSEVVERATRAMAVGCDPVSIVTDVRARTVRAVERTLFRRDKVGAWVGYGTHRTCAA